MRAFASDLDRTLIYSKRMIEEYETNESYELIETLDGEEISFISTSTKEALKHMNESMIFIPVTTRTVEQYKRITLFQKEIQPEYAITSNGGTILKSGVLVKEWSDFITDELRFCMPLHDMIDKIKGLPNTNWIERIKQADNLFIYLIIDRSKISQNEVEELKEWANGHGWQLSLQGRKLYFIPNPINKWKAVEYICKILNIKEVFSAGDSLLDYDLIINSHYGFSPAHGEVLEHYPNIRKTKLFGMSASNEITEAIINRTFLKS